MANKAICERCKKKTYVSVRVLKDCVVSTASLCDHCFDFVRRHGWDAEYKEPLRLTERPLDSEKELRRVLGSIIDRLNEYGVDLGVIEPGK